MIIKDIKSKTLAIDILELLKIFQVLVIFIKKKSQQLHKNHRPNYENVLIHTIMAICKIKIKNYLNYKKNKKKTKDKDN